MRKLIFNLIVLSLKWRNIFRVMLLAIVAAAAAESGKEVAHGTNVFTSVFSRVCYSFSIFLLFGNTKEKF